ncbi:hypothetical protein [Mesorhizobium sangaii]|uniref:Glycine-rich cell wall protein n=1 Tax=Mesorhizobium sangaii TaxID=505389 RepID=A0A841P3M0_9HYPH|nr:hypothetical protein [Mesorhizobium sangaii]MBB6409786.1 hypothetical protein [Mesorhizobium sangaii]
MHRSITTRCCRLALRSAAALALTIAPYQIDLHGSAPGIHAASAQAGKGGGGGGNGGGGGGGGGGNGGNSGGNGNGGNSGGNGGNGNGNSGNSGGNGNGKGNSGTASGNSKSNQGQSENANGSHVNAKTGDVVDVEGKTITVLHPDGITETIENGRFRMEDSLGRTIIDRGVTPADVSRLKAL